MGILFWPSLLAYLIVSGIVGSLASSAKGRNGFGWFVIAVVSSPLFGLLFLIVVGENPERLAEQKRKEVAALSSTVERATERATPGSVEPWKCPVCAYSNKGIDKTCYSCGRDRPA
jgi:Na+/melibiose symporter-like transporter